MIRHSLSSLAMVLLLAGFVLAACGPKYPNCETDKHCVEQGEYCVGGACRECREASHCPASCQTCGATNTCTRIDGCCSSDLDCPGGKCWRAGAETGECGARCDDEHPCGAGQRCVASECVPDVQCVDSSSCGPGQRCENGNCVAGCDIQPVHFDFDEYVLTSDSLSTTRSNAECLEDKAGKITLEGHCDERGTDEYNLALGQRRANSVKKALRKLGISRKRVRTISYGEERPECSSHSESCWWRNRRAELRVD